MRANSNTTSARFRRVCGWLLIAIALLTSAVPLSGDAATKKKAAPKPPEEHALLVNQSNRLIILPPGKSVTVWFDFKNTGKTTWTRDDPHPVGLDTADPLRRHSKFQFERWRAFWRPTRVAQKKVKPGEVGRFRFALKAPKKSGVWTERFAVVRDTQTPIPGGSAEFVVTVGKPVDYAAIYRAEVTDRTLSFWAKPGERVYRPVSFQNLGLATWRNEGFATTTLAPAAADGTVATASSVGTLVLATAPAIQKSAKPKQSATAILDLTAPAEAGIYTQTFGLNGPFGTINGSQFSVNVTVSNDPKPPLDAEPMTRVGIAAVTKPVTVTSPVPYEAHNADTGAVLATMAASVPATVSYNATAATYTLAVKQPDGTASAPQTLTAPIRFVPTTPDGVIEVTSYVNRPGRSTTLNDNVFRRIIEVRYATAPKKLWIINELPLEKYLFGLAEATNSSPPEYLKTLVTAARSYALYHTFRKTKHADENYFINSTTDQVYRGYNYELRTPNITAAVVATRGIVVTHPSMVNEKNIIGVIVAAYSSGTDGRTRSYQEVWGGAPDLFPYLVSVPDPDGIIPDALTRPGNHMVGLSATGALRTSVKENIAFDTLLRYYYTGTSVITAYP